MLKRIRMPGILLLCVGAVCTHVFAQDAGLRQGSIVKNELSVGVGQARTLIPLPGDEWIVFSAEEKEMRMVNALDQHMAPRWLDIHLVQRFEGRFAMAMRIEASKDVLPGRVTSLRVDDPCKRADTIYRNSYDSSGSVVNCLFVNHLVGYLRGASTGGFADLRNWMLKEGMEIPTTVLSASSTQNRTDRYVRVTIYASPATRNLDSTETRWVMSPFHRDNLAKDAARNAYTKEFIAWAETYAQMVSISGPRRESAIVATGTGKLAGFK